MKYIEIAQGSPRYRGTLIELSDLGKFIDKEGTPLYRSLYIYNEEAADYVNKHNSLRNFYGERSIDKILIDIDKGNNSDEYTLDRARSIINDLDDLDVPKSGYQSYFSGTGYHIILHNDLFNFSPSIDLPYLVKATIKDLFPIADLAVLSRTAIYRVAHTKNLKTGLYKVPLTRKELMHLSVDDIKHLASTPRLSAGYGGTLIADGELEEYTTSKHQALDKTRTLSKVREPNKVIPCIQDMLAKGPQEGARNTTAMRIVSSFKRAGIPSQYAKVAILHWNDNQVEPNRLLELTERVYNNPYQYSCNDELMSKHCKTRCIHFKNKDYSIEVTSLEDLQSKLVERMKTDFSGKSIDICAMLGLNGVDSTIYPGELVTVIGRTGSNKSTFVQNLALGVDFANNSIRPEWHIPTLFLSLELADWYMHRRGLQIVSGMGKDDVNNNLEELFLKHKDDLGHIQFQTTSPTIPQIQAKIKEHQPALVIVDYIDLIDAGSAGRSEHEKIKYISHTLSNMAVNNDLIIIQVAQVGREHSKASDDLSLYSAKGSGAIENASRKVISVDGSADNPVKTIRMLKNTDGDSNWEAKVEWNESFRLRRIYD
tara:strand:- start:1038 stop:2828 length:1791 start_codon:yes stop_codon:yes gene_type:complete